MVVVVIDATRTALRFFFNCNGIARKLELTVLSNLLWDPPLLLVVLVLRIVRSDPKRRGMSTVGFVVVGLLLEVRSGSCEKETDYPRRKFDSICFFPCFLASSKTITSWQQLKKKRLH